MIRESRLPLPAGLRPWVADITVGTADDGAVVMTHLPDTASALVFRRTGGAADAVAVGPRTRAVYTAGKSRTDWVRVRLRAGRARLFLGASPADLVDRCVPLAELWGGPAVRLAGDLDRAAGDPAAISGRLRAALLARLETLPPAELSRSELVRGAAASLAAGGPVGDTARRLHISERHLRDVFTGAIGLPPKRFVRIGRLRSVLARASTRRWARLATEAGFYDQAHLTAEFRDLMGVPPAAFLAGRLPAASLCSNG